MRPITEEASAFDTALANAHLTGAKGAVEADLATDPDLTEVAAKVYGGLIGEGLAHEIVHGLLGPLLGPTGHNDPAVANELMDQGNVRKFRQRTGMENAAMVSPRPTQPLLRPRPRRHQPPPGG
ncbi:hypothetical protein ACZ90_45835 [Streptomyces albus subsp. albus]|nr:hypothetical protein ACZ90_45835 [Streptomyces albus subsp. albus]